MSNSISESIHKQFEVQADKTPDTTAVVFENQKLTYMQLNEKSNQLANYLISLGIKSEMLIGISMEKSLDLIIGILGILKAGAAYLPFDFSHPKERLSFILEDADVKFLLTQHKIADNISNDSLKNIYVDEINFDKYSTQNPDSILDTNSLAYVIYTSGSTGKPNGVMITHHNVLRLFTMTQPFFGFTEQDVWTLFHSYSFDYTVWEMWGALLHGGKLIIVPRLITYSPAEYYDLLVNEKVTILNQTPAVFYQLIEADRLNVKNKNLSLRYVFLGGESLKHAMLKPWFTKYGDSNPNLVNLYGPTEATVFATFKYISANDPSNISIIGKPINDTQVFIFDENLVGVKIGEIGELYIGGEGLSRGYLNRPELNSLRFLKNPTCQKDDKRIYKTGDLVRQLENGDLEYIGRTDDQVKIRGYRIELGEIENCIRNFSAINDCVIKVHTYSEGIIRIAAYYISNLEFSLDDLKNHIKQSLPEYMHPDFYIKLTQFPLTPHGKTDYKSLPVPDQAEHKVINNNAGETYKDTEGKLFNIWKELLSLNDIDFDQNFFDLGGNSLLMGRLQMKINEAFNSNITIVDLFQYPTISAISKFLSNKKQVTSISERKNTSHIKSNSTDIAVIGIAGKYPGANNIKEFWNNLVNGTESITFFSDDELEILQDQKDSELKFIKAKGILQNVEKFDADFFGYTIREAELMDPQHRFFLECAWEALEDAGYCNEKYSGKIGVYAGSSYNAYLLNNILKDRTAQEKLVNAYPLSEYSTLTGNDNTFLSTKTAYKLGLNGPAINVQTACSTSLVAAGLAYQDLILGNCDIALAGGVSITFPQKRGYYFVDGSIGSIDGHTKSFDAGATGTVFSHGVGVVVLKRLEDAINDNDSIYAVIKSVAINNDGSNRAGYMTPSVDGQAEVIFNAQQNAGISADTINFVEAHGTATPVGDPIEVTALEKAFRKSTRANQFCAIGSVKSNIGHTDAAAGVTGLIKAVLSLHHRLLPANLHYTKPNPRIDFINSPFYVADRLINLTKMQRPLRAGVSAFGVGGTNAHAILEEFPSINPDCNNNNEKRLLIVSAKTETSLINNTKVFSDYLYSNPYESIDNIAFTLQEGRREFEWRQFFIADSTVNAVKEIEKVINSSSNKAKVNSNDKPHLVFMFPGQGAQYVNMGKGLYLTEKVFKEVVDQCAELLKPYLELDIRDLLYPKENNDDSAKKLEQTVYTQPALFVIEYAVARVLISYNINPSYMIGHSVGDYIAACLAGVFSLEDALFIIAKRAKLMQKQEPGSMLSVRLNETDLKKYLSDDICLAALNSPSLSVLSGPTNKIKELSEHLSSLKIENRVLYTSHAYHSKMMEPALKPFIAEFDKVKLNIPTLPFISSLTGTWITNEQATDPNFWASQLRKTVRFSDGIIELQKKKNIVLIELGPGRALSTMASQHKNEKVKQSVVTTLIQPHEEADDKFNFLTAIGRLWLTGFNIDWKNFYKDIKVKRLHLPTYQFDRKSYWIDPPTKAINNSQISIAKESLSNVNKTVKKPKIKKVMQENNMTRKEYIIDILKEILEELSGIKKTELDETKSFLELGFDSLFMTQISLAFQKKFEVKITLRQLLETNPTIFSIAEYIDANLAANKFEPPKQEIIVEEDCEEYEDSIYTNHADSSLKSNTEQSAVERLVFEQLEIMKKQLEVLGGKKLKINPAAHNESKNIVEASNQTPEPSNGKDSQSSVTSGKKVFERFGPYKPIETKEGGALTDRQQKYLDNFIKDYIAKTPHSKKLTQEHRSHYSDPRTVSGFLPIWKEITYQVIIKKSEASRLWDVDDNEYVDVLMGFGQYLFGHNPKFVRDAIEEQIKLGYEIGPQSPIAGEVAKMICEFTGMERAAFCVTGSEAVLGAIRAARTVTGKDKIVFFAGDYHGIIDEVLIKTNINGDQVRTMPIAPGIPRENVQNTIALEYGSEESLKLIEKMLPEIAAVMVEPVQARRPDFQPKEFLQKLRKITADANVPLIFDEVITGFRTSTGGAQEFYGISADIATYGKIVGGGFPIGIIAGKKLYMDAFDGGYWQYGDDSVPEAGVTFLAGTFVRHPLSLTGAYAVLNHFKSKGSSIQYDLNKKTDSLASELNSFFSERSVPIKILHFSSEMYMKYPADLKYSGLLFYLLRKKGLHILEGFPMFLCSAHSDSDIRFIINCFKESIIELQENGFLPEPLEKNNTQSEKVLADENSVSKYPLADAQKEIWIASKMDDKASCAFNESATLKFKGVLKTELLEEAINVVLKRHSALRTVFSPDGKFQEVKNHIKYVLPVTDLSLFDDQEKIKTYKQRTGNETLTSFDLEKGPLFRCELLKLSSSEHYLIITAHHIICDGWSFDVMVQNLSSIYSNLVSAKRDELPAPMQMSEYVKYLEEFKSTDDYKEQEKFWIKKLSPPFKMADLPVDKLRSSIRSFSGTRVSRTINGKLLESIRDLGNKNRSTFFSTMISAYAVLLSKLTNSYDIITGIPAAGQQIVGADDLIGHCTNLLPLRFDVEGEKSFTQFLSEVKNIVLDAYENQQVSYGDILAKLKIKREAGRIPLLSTMFNIDPAIMGLKFSDLDCEMIANPRTGYQFEMGFNLVSSDTECLVECDYNTDLFSENSIFKFIKYYINILEQITKNTNVKLKDIKILSSEDMVDLMNMINNNNN